MICMEKEDIEKKVHYGSGNVFADLGHADFQLKYYKSRLIEVINEILLERGMANKDAAELFGEDQSNLSKILRGRQRLATTDKLLGWLHKLEADIDTVVTSRPAERHGFTVHLSTDA